VGSLRYGTLSRELDVIARHRLDGQHGVRVDTLELAAAPAGQLALQAARVDVIVSDWLWVSRQRAARRRSDFCPVFECVLLPLERRLLGRRG
jgi:NitT/TauT family transport system substrate-binding protein